jgi:hypothetical protein
VKSRAEKADGQKADINKPIKQKADMTKSRYDKKQAIVNKKPICKKADMQKSRYTKSRYDKKPSNQ